MIQQTKLLLVKLTFPVGVLIQPLAALLLIQLPADVPEVVKEANALDPCHPYRGPSWSSRLLA